MSVTLRWMFRLRAEVLQLEKLNGQEAEVLKEKMKATRKKVAEAEETLATPKEKVEEEIANIDLAIRNWMKHEADMRLFNWRWRLENDEEAISRWLKTQKTEDGKVVDAEAPFTAAEKAEKAALIMKERWWPDQTPTGDEFDKIMDEWVPKGGFPGAAKGEWQVTGLNLRRVARLKRNTAAGLDGWAPAELAILPLGWFNDLADFWNELVRRRGRLPRAWTTVKATMIENGKRALQIITAMWRICISASLANVRTWLADWAEAAHDWLVVGGVPGRNADEIHGALFSDILECAQDGSPLIGARIDQSKCFDRQSAQLNLRILARLGLDEDLVAVTQ